MRDKWHLVTISKTRWKQLPRVKTTSAIYHQPRMDKSEKIFVAGYRGLVGSALIRRLERKGFSNLPKRDSRAARFHKRISCQEIFSRRETRGSWFSLRRSLRLVFEKPELLEAACVYENTFSMA